MKQDATSVFLVEVSGTGYVRVPIRRSQLPATVRFTNSSSASVTVTFTVAAPFTDPTRTFSVPGRGAVDKVVPVGAPLVKSGFTCSSGRTGDIDITP